MTYTHPGVIIKQLSTASDNMKGSFNRIARDQLSRLKAGFTSFQL